MNENCTRCSERDSLLAPTSSSVTGWRRIGSGSASAGRKIPLARLMLKSPAASAAPVEPPATNDEVHAAALQFVRKVSGTTKPSQVNQEAFDRAVHEIAHITRHLLEDLVTAAPPKNREVEAEKARARARLRYAT